MLVHFSILKNKFEILSLVLILILGSIGVILTPFIVSEFCCEYSAIWTVGGILIVVYEILGVETLISLFVVFIRPGNRNRS